MRLLKVNLQNKNLFTEKSRAYVQVLNLEEYFFCPSCSVGESFFVLIYVASFPNRIVLSGGNMKMYCRNRGQR